MFSRLCWPGQWRWLRISAALFICTQRAVVDWCGSLVYIVNTARKSTLSLSQGRPLLVVVVVVSPLVYSWIVPSTFYRSPLPRDRTTRRIGGTTRTRAHHRSLFLQQVPRSIRMLFGRNTRVPFLFGCAEKSPRTLGNPQWNNNLKLAGVRAHPALFFLAVIYRNVYISRAKELRHNYVV